MPLKIPKERRYGSLQLSENQIFKHNLMISWLVGWLVGVLWYISFHRLFNAKFCLYIYVLYIGSYFGRNTDSVRLIIFVGLYYLINNLRLILPCISSLPRNNNMFNQTFLNE